jgi:hypothetical protein
MDRRAAQNRKREAVSTLAELARDLNIPEQRRPKRQDLSKEDFNQLFDYLSSAGCSDAQKVGARVKQIISKQPI